MVVNLTQDEIEEIARRIAYQTKPDKYEKHKNEFQDESLGKALPVQSREDYREHIEMVLADTSNLECLRIGDTVGDRSYAVNMYYHASTNTLVVDAEGLIPSTAFRPEEHEEYIRYREREEALRGQLIIGRMPALEFFEALEKLRLKQDEERGRNQKMSPEEMNELAHRIAYGPVYDDMIHNREFTDPAYGDPLPIASREDLKNLVLDVLEVHDGLWVRDHNEEIVPGIYDRERNITIVDLRAQGLEPEAHRAARWDMEPEVNPLGRKTFTQMKNEERWAQQPESVRQQHEAEREKWRKIAEESDREFANRDFKRDR